MTQANHSSDDILNSSQLIRTAVDSFDSIFQNIQQTNQLIQDVVDKIAKSKKDKMDKPLEDITIESIQVQGSKFDD